MGRPLPMIPLLHRLHSKESGGMHRCTLEACLCPKATIARSRRHVGNNISAFRSHYTCAVLLLHLSFITEHFSHDSHSSRCTQKSKEEVTSQHRPHHNKTSMLAGYGHLQCRRRHMDGLHTAGESSISPSPPAGCRLTGHGMQTLTVRSRTLRNISESV